MGRQLTTEEFIAKAKTVHGDKYDYSKVEYKRGNKKVCIVCPAHGDFWQTANSHLCGRGCPDCSRINAAKQRMSTKEQFIAKAIELYGEFYDYSKVQYNGNKTPVCIVCPVHGEFWQKPNGHLSGHKCPRCSNENKITRQCNSTDWFIEKAMLVHGDKYDYSKTEYKGTQNSVLITCLKHGDFQQTAYTHLRGSGCPLCAIEEGRTSLHEFIGRANSVHGGKYDYSLVQFNNLHDKVSIICPIHGEFRQGAAEHLYGQGCPRCGVESRKRPVFGVGINDYDDNIIDGNGNIKPFYSAWHSMIRRCYSVYHQRLNPSYEGCSVCEEWKRLSNFKLWFDENYIEGGHLDKDILVQGNKVYSPETCCFVPQYINSLLTDHRAARGNCKIGVCKDDGKFVASVNDNTKSVHLGTFDTEDEAFYAYATAKKAVIQKTAKRALDDGKITERVYNALINRNINEY